METQTHYEHLFEESGPRAEFGLGAGQTNRSSNDVEDERTSTSDPEQNTGHEETTQRNEEDPQTRQSGDGMASQKGRRPTSKTNRIIKPILKRNCELKMQMQTSSSIRRKLHSCQPQERVLVECTTPNLLLDEVEPHLAELMTP